MRADDIVAAARSALGTPFVHQGRIAGKGLDCAGLIIYVGHVLGVVPIDRTNYSRRPHDGELQAQLDMQSVIEKVQGPSAKGDILLLRFGSEPQHLAIFSDPNMIHAFLPTGKVVEHVMDDQWKKRITAIYRFKELEP